MLQKRPISPREARRAPASVSGLKFHMRRHQDGLSGDVTKIVQDWPIEKVRRWVQHGILVTEPVSNFLMWGKDVGPVVLKNKLVPPQTIAELGRVQDAIAGGDISGLPVVEQNIPQADEEPPPPPAPSADDPPPPAGTGPAATESQDQPSAAPSPTPLAETQPAGAQDASVPGKKKGKK